MYCSNMHCNFFRYSDLFPSEEHCFLTFEPDSLDVPQNFEGPYNIYFTPNNTASELLLVPRVSITTSVLSRIGIWGGGGVYDRG